MKPVAIWGCGGHGRTVLANFLDSEYQYKIVFFDDSSLVDEVDGVKVKRLLTSIPFEIGLYDWIVGIGDCRKRFKHSLSIFIRNGTFVNSIHRTAVICQGTTIGKGVAIMPHALIGAGATIGDFTIVNNGASVGHMCVVERGAAVNDGSRLGGSCVIGEEAMLGLNVTVLPKVKIGARAIVGAGSVVTKDVPPDVTVVGNPARIIAHRGTHGAVEHRSPDVPATSCLVGIGCLDPDFG